MGIERAGSQHGKRWSRTPGLRITAQVANGAEAFIALMRDRRERGPSGETTVAEIWHTIDRGQTWGTIPWRRAPLVFLSPAIFARWPPEWVNRMWLHGTTLAIEVREDGGTVSRWDPIWSATLVRGRWRVRFDRLYQAEIDGPIFPTSIELDLPGITRPPALGPYR
jgi:hypothetical protein